MAVADILADVVQGAAGAAGNTTAWQAQRQQQRGDQLKFALAPLSQSLQADQTRLALYANPDDPSKPIAGKEKEYQQTVDRMTQTIGQMRRILGQKPDAPNPIEAGVGNLLDKLHITNHLKAHVEKARAAAAKKYQGDNTSMAQQYATGAMAPPNPYTQEETQLEEAGFTPEQIHTALANKAGINPKLTADGPAYKGSDGKWYQNFKDPFGTISSKEMPASYAGPTSNTAEAHMREDFAKDPNKLPGENFEEWKARVTKGAAKVGSFADFMLSGYGPRPTPQQYLDGRKRWAEAVEGTTTGEHTIMVPQPDGSIKAFTVQTSSSKNVGGGGEAGLPSTRQDEPGAASKTSPTATGPKHKALNDTASAHRNSVVQSGDVVGGRKTAAQNKADSDYGTAVKVAALADDAVADPKNPEKQWLLVYNLLHGSLSRVNEVEIGRIQSRGGWAMAPERWEASAKTGGLAPELVKQLADFSKAQVIATQKERDALAPPQPKNGSSGGIKITRDAQGRITGIE